MDKNISFTLKVWRQKGPKAKKSNKKVVFVQVA